MTKKHVPAASGLAVDFRSKILMREGKDIPLSQRDRRPLTLGWLAQQALDMQHQVETVVQGQKVMVPERLDTRARLTRANLAEKVCKIDERGRATYRKLILPSEQKALLIKLINWFTASNLVFQQAHDLIEGKIRTELATIDELNPPTEEPADDAPEEEEEAMDLREETEGEEEDTGEPDEVVVVDEKEEEEGATVG